VLVSSPLGSLVLLMLCVLDLVVFSILLWCFQLLNIASSIFISIFSQLTLQGFHHKLQNKQFKPFGCLIAAIKQSFCCCFIGLIVQIYRLKTVGKRPRDTPLRLASTSPNREGSVHDTLGAVFSIITHAFSC
jgi:hypothetical protein